MQKLSKELLPKSVWNEVKKELKFYWLKKEELACCFYSNQNTTFLISYDVDSKSLNYYTWNEKSDRSLISLIVAGLPEIKKESVSELICPDYLITIIDDFYENN